MPKRKLSKDIDARVDSPKRKSKRVSHDVKIETKVDAAESNEKQPKSRLKKTVEISNGLLNGTESTKSIAQKDADASNKKRPGESEAEDPKKQIIKVKAEVKEEIETGKTETKRKRKTKEEKAAEAMPLATRTVGHRLFIGAHVSSAGGVHNAVTNSVHIGANAFALFLKSQRKWANPPLADDVCSSFHHNCKNHTYEQARHVVPHGSYLVNLAHTDKARTEQAYEAYLDDLRRCEKLGIKLYNVHPGNTVSNDRQAAIAHLANNINKAHSETSQVVTLLENMAAGGNVLGSTFEDLRDIITLVTDKQRIGVCLDTCHAFAGGYDLRSPTAFQATMKSFDTVVGFNYLKAVHLNDSKAPFSSHKDLHANIGTGFLGLRAFHNLVNDSRFAGLPIVLETPITAKDDNGSLLKDEKGKEIEDKGIWAGEIKLLERLVGMDPDSEEFVKLEKQLARKGEPERRRLDDLMERKRLKDEKKKNSPRKKTAKNANQEKDIDDSELSDIESDDE